MFQLRDVLKPRATRLLKASICYCRLQMASLCPSQCWVSTPFPMTNRSRSRTVTFKGNFIIFTGKGSWCGRHLKCAHVFSSGFWFQWFFNMIITVVLLLPSGVKSCSITESFRLERSSWDQPVQCPCSSRSKKSQLYLPFNNFHQIPTLWMRSLYEGILK